MTAFTGDTLTRSNVESVKDLAARTPSLNVDSFSPGQPRYYIRGIGGTSSDAGRDAGIRGFVDEG